MTRKDLEEAVFKKFGNKLETKRLSEELVKFVFETMFAKLAKREEVSISRFGKFSIQKRKARTGVNPQTQEKIKIPATHVVKFKPTLSLKEKVKK